MFSDHPSHCPRPSIQVSRTPRGPTRTKYPTRPDLASVLSRQPSLSLLLRCERQKHFHPRHTTLGSDVPTTVDARSSNPSDSRATRYKPSRVGSEERNVVPLRTASGRGP